MGYIEPRLISLFPEAIWVIIVGITALQLCLGPYVLNGLIIDIGVLNECQKLSAIWSAPILDAAYGDWPTKGWFSLIGTNCALP